MENFTLDNYDKDTVLTIDDGIIGFEKYKKYIPFPFEEGEDSIVYLQSEENKELSFITMNPFYLMPDYNPELSSEDLRRIGCENQDNIIFLVITVIKGSMRDSTVNMKCPIAINTENRKAAQIILENDTYGFRHCLGDMLPGEDE